MVGGSKGRYGLFAGKTVCCHKLSERYRKTLYKGALQMPRFTLLFTLPHTRHVWIALTGRGATGLQVRGYVFRLS